MTTIAERSRVRRERYTVTFERKVAAPPAPVTPPPRRDAPTPSPERIAWDEAYASGQGHGPLSAVWPEDGRHVPYMRWQLAYNSGGERFKRPNQVAY